MASASQWPRAELIHGASVVLGPLQVEDAAEVASALDDPALHQFIGGKPASAVELRSRFTLQVVGHSPDGAEGWLNWVIRDTGSRQVVGTAQATLTQQSEGLSAAVAWVIGTAWQGQGRAKDASGALVEWLGAQGVHVVVADIHPDHAASAGVARSIGLDPTDTIVDGEVRWMRTI